MSENLLDLRKYEMDISEYQFMVHAAEKDVEQEIYDERLCEQKTMIMMIGLPSSGKRSHALNFVSFFLIFKKKICFEN